MHAVDLSTSTREREWGIIRRTKRDFKQKLAQVDNYGPKTCPMAPAGAPAASANGATSAANSASPSASGASIGTGAIVGIVVGVAALLALLAALLALFLVRRRRDANDMGPLHMLPIHKHFSQGGKVGNSLTPLGQSVHVSKTRLQIFVFYCY